MTNKIKAYHLETSYRRSSMEGYPLDWKHQPGVYKSYPVSDAIPFEKVLFTNQADISELSKKRGETFPNTSVTKETLAEILALGYSLTAVTSFQGKDFYYRSMPSAGALYPNEIYLVVYDEAVLPPGIYHYMIKERCLVPVRPNLPDSGLACFLKGAGESTVAATLVLTGIFFRTSWKYRKRGYRYVLNDTGHLEESLYLACLFSGIRPVVRHDFDDERLNSLLPVNPEKEVALSLIDLPGKTLSISKPEKTRVASEVPKEMLDASEVSEKEVRFPEILEIHRASMAVPHGNIFEEPTDLLGGIAPDKRFDIPAPGTGKQLLPFPENILKRRSKRNFVRDDMAKNDFHLLLHLLCDYYADNLLSVCPVTGFLANRIEEYEHGFYLLDPEKRKVGFKESGEFAALSAAVCLNQKWLENAAVHFLFMAGLKKTEENYGPRGYRYLMKHAGRLGHLVYIGSTALSLGACGIGALFDFEAQEMLDLSENTFLLYLVAAGPVKRS